MTSYLPAVQDLTVYLLFIPKTRQEGVSFLGKATYHQAHSHQHTSRCGWRWVWLALRFRLLPPALYCRLLPAPRTGVAAVLAVTCRRAAVWFACRFAAATFVLLLPPACRCCRFVRYSFCLPPGACLPKRLYCCYLRQRCHLLLIHCCRLPGF